MKKALIAVVLLLSTGLVAHAFPSDLFDHTENSFKPNSGKFHTDKKFFRSFAIKANAGKDTTLPFSLMGAVTKVTLKGSGSGGTITSWQWSKVSGAPVTIANPNAQNTVVTGFQPGFYVFQLTVSDGSTTSTDMVNVKVIDYQKRGESPCRVGAPVTWNLAPTNPTMLMRPYLKTDGFNILGGDTVKIPTNPKNGGVYAGISLGEFGGSAGCPVVVVPSGIVTITGPNAFFRLGGGSPGDTSFVSHIKIDGTYLRSKGVKYGFQFTNPTPAPNCIGLSVSLVTDLEASGFYIQNVGNGIVAKMHSDSTTPWRLYNNFYMKNLNFHDMYIRRTTGEAMYLGHTSPNGDPILQPGNDGPTVRIDSIEVHNILIDSAGWDGIQVSNAIYASIHDNIVIRAGVTNLSSQRAWILLGGNTTGKIFNNVGYNLKEGIRGFPYGNVEVYNNYGDSIFIGNPANDGLYMTGAATGPGTNILESRPNFKPYIHDNIFNRFERCAIMTPDVFGYSTPGEIAFNLVVTTKTLPQVIGTANGDYIHSNQLFPSFPVKMSDISTIANGVNIQVTQLDSTNNFSDAASIISWLRCRLSGSCSPLKKKPTADAGPDAIIGLPLNIDTLKGSGTGDGTILYQWAKVSGPTTFSLINPNTATAIIKNLVQGTYGFELTVTDDIGQIAKDTMYLTVNSLVNQLPIANAGANQIIYLPTNSINLDGTGSVDPNGTALNYNWTQVSGPATVSFSNAASATPLADGMISAGVYLFKLVVTDLAGATAADSVTVTVNAGTNQAPTANAGANQTITLPVNSITADGSASVDPDGSISSYQWTKVSGPAAFNIVDANSATTVINGLAQGTYEFKLTVTDNSGVTDVDSISVTVNGSANQSPVANAGANQTITLPINTVIVDGSASSDPDGTISSYAWTKVSGPAAATIVNASSANTSISGLAQGTYVFRLSVTDNSGATNTDSVLITVNAAANQAPTANAGTSVTITLPTNTVSLNGSGSLDPDGSISTYSWAQVSGPSAATLTGPGTASPTAGNLVLGQYIFQLTVTDNLGATATAQVKVTVAPAAGVQPIANAGANQSITLPANAVSLDGSASTAPGGSIASYGWVQTSGPAPGSISGAGSATTLVTGLLQGTYIFTLTITDNNGLTATDQVTVTVNAAINIAPVANAGSSISISLPTNSASLSGSSSSDADGTIASYSWIQLSGPAASTLTNASSANVSVSGLIAGQYTFELTVTDNQGAVGKAQVKITVLAPADQAPVANAGSSITITLPVNSATLNGSGSTDPDGSLTAYNWVQVSGPSAASLDNAATVSATAGNLVAGQYIFELTVTDNQGATGKAQVKVTVRPAANQPPTANAGTSKTIILPVAALALDGSKSSDADGSIISYSWVQVSGPSAATLSGANTVSASAGNLVAGQYVFELTVTDNQGATGKAQVKINAVTIVNQPPIANAGSNQTIVLPTGDVFLDGTKSFDADGTIAAYAWIKISGANLTISGASTATPQLTGLQIGQYVFQLTVTDNLGATATDQVTVDVTGTGTQTLSPVELFANAGKDTTVAFPAGIITLDGSASKSLNGTISTYQWTQLSGPGTATISNTQSAVTQLTDLFTGGYIFQLTVTDNLGNTASATVKVNVIDNLRSTDQFILFPNPAAAEVNLKLIGDASGKLSIKIFDMGGKLVHAEELFKAQNQFTSTMNISGLSRGMYTVQAIIGDKRMVTKLIKQ